jgi:hypothetical protein
MTEVTSRKRACPISSALLETGEVVEMIRPSPGKTAFAVWDGNSVRQEERIEADGTSIVPYPADNTLLTHDVILLPSGVEEYSSTAELRARVQAFIHRYVDLSPAFEEAASVYVLFSWIYDDFSALPYLRVRGDYGSGKSRFLLCVGSLCYTPIFSSGASTVSPLFRIMDVFRGTLVLDEADFRLSDEKADIVKILNNGNARGFPVLRADVSASKQINPTAFNVYGPKLIATRRSFEDQALESRSITEELGMRPLRRDIPLNLPPSFKEEAERLRRQLLLFRFRNRGRERDLSAFVPSSLTPRVAQLFAPLLATVEEAEVRERLVLLARGVHRELLRDRAHDPACELLSVLAEIAQERAEPLSVQELAEIFSSRSLLDRPVTPRYVGYLLRQRLFLKPERRRGVFVLPVAEFEKLPALLSRYGLSEDIGDVGDVGTGAGNTKGLEQ